MFIHNPDCTNGGAHAYSACRDRYNQPLKMVEVPDSVLASEPVPFSLEEAAKIAFGGLVHPVIQPVAVDTLPGVNRADLGAHDPQANPDADADAAQRSE
jgi:hypothetical protein